MSTVIEMPKYKCHKVVHALKIKDIVPDIVIAIKENRDAKDTFWITPEDETYSKFEVKNSFLDNVPGAEKGGYYVLYENGYASWSSTKAFEDDYTLLFI